MIKMSYGVCYLEESKSKIKVQKFYAVKRSPYSNNWLVYETFTDQIVLAVPTRLRALYVAARYNGTDVSQFFKFGEVL